jgi:acyl-CoA synthetase (AMP-forming)/AMP-acid ligase II
MEPSLPRIDAYLRYHAQNTPDREAWITGDTRLTYTQAESFVERIARALLALGITRGECVGVFGKPRHEPIAIYLALGRIGAIYVGLNPKYKYDELHHILSDCAPVAIISAPGLTREHHQLMDQIIAAHNLAHDIRFECGFMGWDAFLDGGNSIPSHTVRAAEDAVLPEDTALLVYTSGSTGKPKGAMLPHRGLLFVAPIVQDLRNFGTKAPPRALCALPINHVGAMVDICSNTIWDGGAIIFLEDFDPYDMLRMVEAEKLTLLGGVPLMFMMMAQVPAFHTTDYSSVEKVMVAGNAAPVALVELLQTVIKKPVMTGYGLTECMGFSSFSASGDSAEVIATTIGKFDPRVRWRIVDTYGQECTVGTVGEIQMRGDTVFLGYLNRPDANAKAFTQDGWFCTGDLGELMSDGNIRLVGRSTEMFKSGGYNVYPLEVEQALERIDGVAMAVVVPVPDPLYCEVGYAFILANEPDLDLITLNESAKAVLANYKVPKHFICEQALPMLPIGKVDRVALKARAQRLFPTD